MRSVELRSGRSMPVLGQGTWHMGEDPSAWRREVEALRLGLDLGMTLIDTAEMYGEGSAETLVGEAIAGRRAEVFLVSKIYPHNATTRGVPLACERSLARLGTDHLDVYLLHWRGAVPLEETFAAFQQLKRRGAIVDYGVSNFDVGDMEEAVSVPGGEQIVTDQVLYNLRRRGIEWDLLPWCRGRAIPLMAYSPVEQGELLVEPTVAAVAARHGATPAQIAIAWLLQKPDVVAIPKAGDAAHVRENRDALEIRLDERDLRELDRAFPPPRHKVPLAVR